MKDEKAYCLLVNEYAQKMKASYEGLE